MDLTTITIDGKAYDFSQLTDSAKQQLGNLGAVDQEIARLNVQLAIAHAARAAYSAALKEALPQE